LDKWGTVKAGDYIFFYGKLNIIINWEQDFVYITEYYKQRVQFVSDRVSYIVLRGHLCNIIV